MLTAKPGKTADGSDALVFVAGVLHSTAVDVDGARSRGSPNGGIRGADRAAVQVKHAFSVHDDRVVLTLRRQAAAPLAVRRW